LTNPLPTQARSNGVPNTQGNPRDMLNTEKTERAFAVKAIDESLVIPKGTQIDCGLTTRAITEISGFASCQVTRDVYSANGRVLLIERMSVVDGEYAAQSQAGQRYIHVLWTRVRKPGGTTIDIASPATDGLGGAGIPAIVDNRWMERIGGAYLLSFIKDAIAYKTATDSSTGDSVAASVAYQNTISTSQSMAEKVLSNTIGIKPLLYANQGDRVAIYVARDVDFSQIYAIRNK
jgi:type IV secretion system protein VirB10